VRDGAGETVVEIEERALEDLLDGIDVELAPARRKRSAKPAVH
jgi:hypothetical protein